MAITLTGVRVWDGLADEVSQQPWCIRIEGDRISALGPDPRLADGAQVLDFKDQFAIPGLMDAHVHLTLDEKLPSWKAQTEVAAEARSVAMQERAVAMLAAGITTARDLGAGECQYCRTRHGLCAGAQKSAPDHRTG